MRSLRIVLILFVFLSLVSLQTIHLYADENAVGHNGNRSVVTSSPDPQKGPVNLTKKTKPHRPEEGRQGIEAESIPINPPIPYIFIRF
jgi:hypothetical protein